MVFDNGALSFVELEMKAGGIVTLRHRPGQPRLRRGRQSDRTPWCAVGKAGDLGDALRAAFAHDGPAVIDVHTTRHEISLSPKITPAQLKGFTLYPTRTILSGNADEILETACANSTWNDPDRHEASTRRDYRRTAAADLGAYQAADRASLTSIMCLLDAAAASCFARGAKRLNYPNPCG
ncbi:hypothetical protein KUA19_29945 [Catellatospora sp. NEAU-YM18]|nr:hypothetical protein [Catellatospora tritici]